MEGDNFKDCEKDKPKKFVLYREIDGTTYEVDLPLTSNVDVKELMNDLGLPSYVDLNYYPMRSAIVTLWACQRAHELHKLYPEAFQRKVSDKPIAALLFGGGAVKIHCPHANGKESLSRVIHDMDFIIPKKQGSGFVKLLVNMGKAFGTQFKAFKTRSDILFNGMRQGQRYRVRVINGITEEGFPTVTVIDIFCDYIDLRHKIDVRDSFKNVKENLYTIGLENLILSKCQFIMDLPKSDLHLLKEHNQEFRLLPYPYYAKDKVVLGMEEKDSRDICAVFLDHTIGEGKEEINLSKMQKALKDKKTALTVTLNLKNLMQREDFMAGWLSKSEISTIVGRIGELLSYLPKVEKKWDKPWWNTEVETPHIQ